MNYSVKTILICLLTSLSYFTQAQRINYTINESWSFNKGDHENAPLDAFNDTDWEKISIPHTWNNLDARDDEPGYYRGPGWYRRKIFVGNEALNKQVYACFEGSNQVTELWVNGQFAGKHIGGYTRFNFNITPFLKPGELNQFAIKVDNSHDPDIPPLSADFTFFGGIYRDVSLVFTSGVSISLNDYASSGVYITTSEASEDKASIEIRTILDNNVSSNQKINIEHTLVAPDGSIAAKNNSSVRTKSNQSTTHLDKNIIVENPDLWSVNTPDLYKVYTRIYNSKTGDLLDEVVNPLGIRWYSFHPEKGFFLNGHHVKLIGTNRHQDFEGMGNALPDEMHVRDLMLLKEMGGNFLRISHYPQDPIVLEMCDKLGIIASVEIPVVNAITESEAFTSNSVEMAKEMIRQDYNRPSIVIWNYMNEVMLRPPYEKDTEEYKQYSKAVGQYGRVMEATIREEDPTRYTMLVFHGNLKAYEDASLVELPQLVGWNLYQGWYGGKFSGFDSFLDSFHEKYPAIPVFVSEYGADVDPRLHSFEPKRFDFTAEYANMYHEHYLKAISERPFVAGANIWNLNDFHSESRGDAMPHINNKGITTLSRELKDTYLLYKAFLKEKPVVQIGSRTWKTRGGIADDSGNTFQPLNVYSNAPEVALTVNGKFHATAEVFDNIARFDVPFVAGKNTVLASIEVDNQTYHDFYETELKQVPQKLNDPQVPFHEINITLGSERYYEDKKSNSIWMPEKPYTPGSWGYIGGTSYKPKTRFGVLPSADINITSTEHDPIFQTQRVGIEQFRLDLTDGQYAVYLYWAELESDKNTEALAYNLGQDILSEDAGPRTFNVKINSIMQLDNFDISSHIGAETAIVKKFIVNANNNEGLKIEFDAIEGNPVLNAIRVYKIY